MVRHELIETKVREVFTLIERNALVIKVDSSIDELLEKMASDARTRHVYVVDDTGKLTGTVRLNSVISYLHPSLHIYGDQDNIHSYTDFFNYFYFSDAKMVREIMDDSPVSVTLDTDMIEVLSILSREKINELPIVDEGMKVIGEVNLLEIVTHYKQVRKA